MSDYVGNKKAGRLAPGGVFSGSLMVHGLLVGFVLVYGFAYLLLLRFLPGAGAENPVGLVVKLTVTISILTLISLFCKSCYVAFRRYGKNAPVSAIGRAFWAQISDPGKAVPGFVMLVIMIAFSFVYVQVKKLIPAVTPFSWDNTFYLLDKSLHFGVNPWEWLDLVFGDSPLLVSALNFNYNIWFFVMWLTVVHFAFMTRKPILRTRFFLTFFLTWAVGGGLLAMVFSSAGPAFYGRLGLTPDVYAPLMDKLAQMNQLYPVWAIGLQDKMWLGYTGQGINIGISAMPSMHNATTMLLGLGVWQISRKAGWWLAGHGFFIAIGSVYLGWHYAVDVYLGWAIALVGWYLSGFVARWWHGREDVKAFQQAGIDSLQHRA